MMKKWKIKERVEGNLEEQLFYSLGLKKEEDKKRFLNPDYEKDLYDSFEILNMGKAVKRILKAVEKNEKIVLFGDYDTDGVCATTIFHDFFKKIGFENFDIYIPDRNKEGYGLNLNAIDEIYKDKTDLIITLDCGITDYDEIRKINELKMDCIVLDHHLQAEKLPQAIAVVDPKQKKDNYPFEMLCGTAVAFKTVQALIDKGDFNITPGWEKWLLDLVCVATIADMVPLQNENRVLAYYGLRVFKKTQRLGLLALLQKLRLKKENIAEDDIAFLVAPRINITSRMDHANTSYALLTTLSSSEANWIVEHLERLNKERREVVEKILNQIDEIIARKKIKPEIIIEGDLSWRVGVLGLTANRVMEKYSCPVFLWGKGEAKNIKGSARSPNVNLVDLMENLPKNLLKEFGGHALSAGFSLDENKINEFGKELIKVFSKIDDKEKGEDILWIDKEICLEEINWNFLETIEKFKPFGIGNPQPVFLLKNLEVFNMRTFGNGGLHLQLDFKKGDGKVISAIGFFMPTCQVDVQKGSRIDLVASVERNRFNGANEIRLRIIDLKIL